MGPRPTVLVNAASCSIGGGVQVACAFIRHLLNAKELPFCPVFAISPEIAAECQAQLDGIFPYIIAHERPGRPFAGWRTREALRRFADAQHAKAVFTVLGPSYVNFSQPELVGFADGFAYALDSECYANHPLREKITSRLNTIAKLHFLSRAKAFWVETDFAKQGLAARLDVPLERIFVVPNSLNPTIRDCALNQQPAQPPRLLMLAAGYWHKNHIMIPQMAKSLAILLPSRPFRIDLTLDPRSPVLERVLAEAKQLGVQDKIVNLGRLSLEDCAQAIESSTALVHPSLLETFSATYLEAMGLRRPLLVSDRPFAREVCGDAALYFDPFDPASAAAQAAKILTDGELRATLVRRGLERLGHFPSPEAKNDRLLGLVENFLKQNA